MQAVSVQQSGKNKSSKLRFEAINGGDSSSLLVFDARKATSRGVAKYIYAEYGAKNPVQTGTWENMRLHLIAPNAQFDLATGSTN